jgi:hypothetical protein
MGTQAWLTFFLTHDLFTLMGATLTQMMELDKQLSIGYIQLDG